MCKDEVAALGRQLCRLQKEAAHSPAMLAFLYAISTKVVGYLLEPKDAAHFRTFGKFLRTWDVKGAKLQRHLRIPVSFRLDGAHVQVEVGNTHWRHTMLEDDDQGEPSTQLSYVCVLAQAGGLHKCLTCWLYCALITITWFQFAWNA